MTRFLVLIILGLIAYEVYQQILIDDQESINPSSKPDQYMIQLIRYEYDPQGILECTVEAKKAMHYKDKNTTLFIEPKIVAYHKKQIAWEMQAEHGILQSENDTLSLWGNVRIHQPEYGANPETLIETKQVRYYPHRAIAESDRPVTITRPGVKLQAEGMTVDLKQGLIQTSGHTQGSYDQR